MGALTVTFAIRRYGIPDAVVLSLVTSSIMLGMKLDKLILLKHWYAIVVGWRGSSLLWQALVASVGLLQRRWDKINAWKGKIDEHEMFDAELTRRHGMGRSAAHIKAELDRLARLISGLPTNVEPGDYEAALETHLTSLFSALQLELEQTPEASGTNCNERHRRPVSRRAGHSSHSRGGHHAFLCLCVHSSCRVYAT
jgi:hypothetical protein